MPIEYALYPNNLTNTPNDYRAMVKHARSLSQTDIIDDMMRRGSTVTRADALASLENYEAAVASALSSGYRVNTPLINYSLSISGTFAGQQDYFDPKRHELHINCNRGLRLKELTEELSLQKVDGRILRPTISWFRDVQTDTRNDQLTPGGIAIVSGRHLKIEPDDSQQGVFFVSPDSEKVHVERFIRNKPSELIFSIPDQLTAHHYTLRIAAKPKNTIERRVGQLDEDLLVV
jgi:hypothetical protein